MTIEKIKNWVRKHKNGVILVVGGTAAATLGVKAICNHYYFVPKKSDMFTIAKDSVIELDIPDAVKQLGNVDVVWENAEHFNTSISNVPWDKIGEAGKVIRDSYEVKDVESVGVMITIPK
jgi:hypothetical protein